MLNKKIFVKFLLAISLIACALTLNACADSKEIIAKDTVQDTVIQEIATEDSISERVSFGKKYYFLGYDGIVKTEYYTLTDDGAAIYTHIMQAGTNVTFHQEINFKWTYIGEGSCVLIHNGTKMIKGEQDDAFGIARVMKLAKDVIYWSASGENTYYINEDFIAHIPNYAKLIKNG